MGHFTSIRGWLEVNEEMVVQVKAVIQETAQREGISSEETEYLKFYNRGWVFPTDHINWTWFIFYGADIRSQHVDLLKAQITTIAGKVSTADQEFHDFPAGLFHVDDEDGTLALRWELKDGHLQEIVR